MKRFLYKKVFPTVPLFLFLVLILVLKVHAQTPPTPTYPIGRCSNTYAYQWVTYNSSNSAGGDILPSAASADGVLRTLNCGCPAVGDTSWNITGVQYCSALLPQPQPIYGINRCSNTYANQWVQYASSNSAGTNILVPPNTPYNTADSVNRTLNCGCPATGLDATWSPGGVASCAPAPVATPPPPVVVPPPVLGPSAKAPTLIPITPRPTLSYTQGDYYSNGVNNYESNNNYLSTTDNYLILRSADNSFDPLNNQIYVSTDSSRQVYNSLPPSTGITYQSAGQINILLGILQDTSFSIYVQDAGGKSFPVAVTAEQANSTLYPITPTPTAPPITIPVILPPTIPTMIPTPTPTTTNPIGTTIPVIIPTTPSPTPTTNSNPLGITIPTSSQTPFSTKTVTSGNNQYTINYYYLPDGEVKATFSYTYSNSGLPAYARGTQNYIDYVYTSGGVAVLNNGVSLLDAGNDCNTASGAGSCIEVNSNFNSLIANIKASAPPTLFPPGISFASLPTTPAGTYLSSGYPVTIATDTNGNIISVQSVNNTGAVSWYNLGAGYYLLGTGTPGYMYLKGPNIPSTSVVVLENAQPNVVSGTPISVSGEIALTTPTNLSKYGFKGLASGTAGISFVVEGTGSSIQSSVQNILNQIEGTTPSTTVSGAIYDQLRNAPDIATAVSIARNAGLIVTGGAGSDGSATYLVKTNSGAFIAALGHDLGQDTISKALGAPIYAGSNYSNNVADSQTCTANVGSKTARVLVWPDGNIYNLAGVQNYTLSTNCGPNDPVTCTQTQTAAAVGAANVFLAGGSAPTNNASNGATIKVVWVDAPTTPVSSDSSYVYVTYADSNPIILADGTASCQINVYSQTFGQKASDSTAFIDLLTHEIGHCMGLGHATVNDDVMYAYFPFGNQHFSEDDKTVLSFLKSGADIPVSNCDILQTLNCNPSNQILVHDANNVYSCQSCPTGQVIVQNVSGSESCESCPDNQLYQYVDLLFDHGQFSSIDAVVNKCDNLCLSLPGESYDILGHQCVTSCDPNLGLELNENKSQCECALGKTYDVNNKTCVTTPACTSGYIVGDECYPTPEVVTDSQICFKLADGTQKCETQSYCSTHLNDPDCVNICLNDPTSMPECKSIFNECLSDLSFVPECNQIINNYCSANPNDVNCNEYCSENVTDPSCAYYCQQNPEDQACID